MSTILWTIVVIVIWLFIFGFRLEFKPFKISFTNWMQGVAWLLIVIGVGIYGVSEYSKAYAKGLKRGGELYKEVLEENIDEMIKEKIDGTTRNLSTAATSGT